MFSYTCIARIYCLPYCDDSHLVYYDFPKWKKRHGYSVDSWNYLKAIENKSIFNKRDVTINPCHGSKHDRVDIQKAIVVFISFFKLDHARVRPTCRGKNRYKPSVHFSWYIDWLNYLYLNGWCWSGNVASYLYSKMHSVKDSYKWKFTAQYLA